MADKGTSGFKRIYNATRYSFAGLAAAFKNEAAFRQELLLMLILIPAALWLGEGAIEKVLLISSLLLVLIVELINSAIEVHGEYIGNQTLAESVSLTDSLENIGSKRIDIDEDVYLNIRVSRV